MNYRFTLKAFSALAVLLSASLLYSQSQETTSTQPSPQAATPPQAGNNAQPSDKNAASEKNAAPDKDTVKPQAPTAAAASKGCLAVKPIGSHVFRNVMLLGVTGALISKQQYKVMDAVDYPAPVGAKFHGDDLMTISSNGTKVVILNKHYKEEDLQKSCH